MVGWLVVLGLAALLDSISVYIGPSPREREKEERTGRREKNMSKQPQPGPTASAVGPCPTMIQISRAPRHCKFTQHHRTTRPTPLIISDDFFSVKQAVQQTNEQLKDLQEECLSLQGQLLLKVIQIF